MSQEFFEKQDWVSQNELLGKHAQDERELHLGYNGTEGSVDGYPVSIFVFGGYVMSAPPSTLRIMVHTEDEGIDVESYIAQAKRKDLGPSSGVIDINAVRNGKSK